MFACLVTRLWFNILLCAHEDGRQAANDLRLTCLQELRKQGVSTVDYALVDHISSAYLKDTLILQGSGLLKKGSIIVADNVVLPGAPDFRKYVTTSPDFQTLEHIMDIQFSPYLCDIMTVSKYVGYSPT